MENNIRNEVDEKTIIKWQYGALIAAFIIFGPLAFVSRLMVHITIRYFALLAILPMFYIAISSMKNRVSIIRLRGQKEYPKGKQAFLYGAIFLIVEIATFIFFLTPLSDKYVNF